ncbi:hypothetical protein HNQ91_002844 [Filimonas zeae]|nr:hypothetical protein [Filimonas zeae]MDR6339779.1 hypothetical protein [Filimonas zeae]
MKKNLPPTAAATEKGSIWNLVFLLLAIIPVVLLFKLVNSHALNIPYNDDWDAILGFLNTWKHADNKMELLFAQHNEHRILASKLIYVGWYILFHNINILSVIYIANLQLLVIAAILAYFSGKVLDVPYFKGLLVFVIALCVFDIASYDNIGFAMAGLQNYGVVMLFLLSLFFYSLRTKRRIELLPALLFQFICAFSSGNGFMAGIALLLYTVFSKDRLNMLVCLAGFAIFTACYFLTYHSVSGSVDMKAKSAGMFLFYFLKLSGSHFNFEYGVAIAVVLYAVLGASLFYQFKQADIDRILPFLCLLLFTGMSMAATALLRSGQAHIFDSESISSRYLIYSQLLAIVVFVMLVFRFQHHKQSWIAIAICTLFFIKAYRANYSYGAEALAARNNRLSLTDFVYPDKKHAREVAAKACKNEIYCIEENRP